MKPELGILGLPIIPCKIVDRLPGASVEIVAAKGAMLWIALGLAMQGISEGMPKGDFLSNKETKQGLLSVFAKKPVVSDLAWGIDIGDSSIKAIQVRRLSDPSKVGIEKALIVPLEGSSGKSRRFDSEAVKSTLQKLVHEHAIGDLPVVVNFAGNECATRFNLLPPSADKKKLDDFVIQDVRAHLPMSLDLLQTAYHIFNRDENEAVPPASVLAAARRPEIESRQSLVEGVGLKLAGIQPEPFALWNALRAVSAVESQLDSLRSPNGSKDSANSAELLIDVGHHRTNILISGKYGLWFRTLDWGLSDMTQALCKSQQMTFAEADKLRREPLRAELLQLPLNAMSAACQIPCRELQRSVQAAGKPLEISN